MIRWKEFLFFWEWSNPESLVTHDSSPDKEYSDNHPSILLNSRVPCSWKENVNLALLFKIFIIRCWFGIGSICLGHDMSSIFIWTFSLTAAAALVDLKFVFIENYSSWKEHDYEKEVGWNDDGSINSEGLNGHHWAQSIWQECNSCSTWCDSYSSHCSLPSIRHSLFLIALEHFDKGTLSPSINKDEDVVSSNTKDDEDDEVVQISIELYSKYSLVENSSEAKWEKDEEQANSS